MSIGHEHQQTIWSILLEPRREFLFLDGQFSHHHSYLITPISLLLAINILGGLFCKLTDSKTFNYWYYSSNNNGNNNLSSSQHEEDEEEEVGEREAGNKSSSNNSNNNDTNALWFGIMFWVPITMTFYILIFSLLILISLPCFFTWIFENCNLFTFLSDEESATTTTDFVDYSNNNITSINGLLESPFSQDKNDDNETIFDSFLFLSWVLVTGVSYLIVFSSLVVFWLTSNLGIFCSRLHGIEAMVTTGISVSVPCLNVSSLLLAVHFAWHYEWNFSTAISLIGLAFIVAPSAYYHFMFLPMPRVPSPQCLYVLSIYPIRPIVSFFASSMVGAILCIFTEWVLGIEKTKHGAYYEDENDYFATSLNAVFNVVWSLVVFQNLLIPLSEWGFQVKYKVFDMNTTKSSHLLRPKEATVMSILSIVIPALILAWSVLVLQYASNHDYGWLLRFSIAGIIICSSPYVCYLLVLVKLQRSKRRKFKERYEILRYLQKQQQQQREKQQQLLLQRHQQQREKQQQHQQQNDIEVMV